jgi:hypothetical protein
MFKWYEIEFSGRYARLAESPEEALDIVWMDKCGYPDIKELADDELTDDEREEMNEANDEDEYEVEADHVQVV